jgi:hypothetical protein
MACLKPVGGVSVSSGGHEHVDDLAELVDRAVHIAPLPGDLQVGLIDLPAVAPRGRQGRAASASSGVNRWTQR